MKTDLEQRLKTLLSTSEEIRDPAIDMRWEGIKLVARVVSPSFEGIDEAERQAVIWDLLEQLPAEDRRRIEFVFTDSPSEEAA